MRDASMTDTASPRARPRRGPPRYLAAAGALLIACAQTLAGCQLPISPRVFYKPEKEEREPIRAKKRNDLKLGIRELKVQGPAGEPADPEAGDARQLGRNLAEAIRDTLVFQEVVYPLRDEQVDVVFAPVLTVTLTKNRLTNALKVFPGLILPWIDGMGFDYDHTAVLTVDVHNAKRDGALCETLRGESAMLAERYPSILWFLGIHVGLLILLVFESATTDHIVLQQVVDLSFARALEPVLERTKAELSPTAKPCPDHPDEEQVGRYCIVDGRDLYYPILLRGQAAPTPAPKPAPEQAPPPR